MYVRDLGLISRISAHVECVAHTTHVGAAATIGAAAPIVVY